MYVCMYVCMYVRLSVCMYVCMYVCIYICMYMRAYFYLQKEKRHVGSPPFWFVGSGHSRRLSLHRVDSFLDVATCCCWVLAGRIDSAGLHLGSLQKMISQFDVGQTRLRDRWKERGRAPNLLCAGGEREHSSACLSAGTGPGPSCFRGCFGRCSGEMKTRHHCYYQWYHSHYHDAAADDDVDDVDDAADICVCLCVCICIYTCVYTYIYIHTCMCTCMHT